MTAPTSFGLNGGVTLRPAETFLASRARDFLAAGPADVVPLIEHVCQIPGAPRRVAEHMAHALLGERTEFVRGLDGRWRLGGRPPTPCAGEVAPGTDERVAGDTGVVWVS